MPIFRDYYDARDGQAYSCVLMPDGKWWSARNLEWAGAGYDWEDNPANRPVFARLYLGTECDAAVPTGTHIPNSNEWTSLFTAVGNSWLHLRATSGWGEYPGDNSTGFNAVPCGPRNAPSYYSNPERGYWWSASNGAGLRDNVDANPYSFNVGFSQQVETDHALSVRFIVDTFVDPPSVTLFGAPFNGFERGLSCKIKRPILVDDSEGGSVTLIPTASAAFDEWQIEAEFWVPDEYAQQIETCVPPRGVPLENAIRLPPRNGEASFPGLFPYQATAGYDLYSVPMVTSLESLGRKGPRLDLIGYRIAFSLFAEADGLALNASPTPTTTPPAWLSGKFAAHQIQDWSNQGEVVAATTLAGHPSIKGSFYPVRHGRRRDANFNLDHLSTDRANELVAFFRGVRHNPVTITLDRGPEGLAATSVYLTELDLQRGAGLWWDGTLKAVLA